MITYRSGFLPAFHLALAGGWCLAVGMADDEVSKNVPSDEHLRQDVAPETGAESQGTPDSRFTPGQTNAGQQVAGLASASGYGDGVDPDEQPDGNNPV